MAEIDLAAARAAKDARKRADNAHIVAHAAAMAAAAAGFRAVTEKCVKRRRFLPSAGGGVALYRSTVKQTSFWTAVAARQACCVAGLCLLLMDRRRSVLISHRYGVALGRR